jgi:hypothetical protein
MLKLTLTHSSKQDQYRSRRSAAQSFHVARSVVTASHASRRVPDICGKRTRAAERIEAAAAGQRRLGVRRERARR